MFTRGEPADASRLGWACRLARCGGLQRESGAPASVQSGACGGPQCAEWRLRLASEHGASGAQRACRAAPAAGYAVECRAALPAAGYTRAERRRWRAGEWRAGEPQNAQRDAGTGQQRAERRLRRMGWRAGEQQKAQSGACGGLPVRLAERRLLRATRRTERRLRLVAAGWRAGEPQSAQSGASGGLQRAERRLWRATLRAELRPGALRQATACTQIAARLRLATAHRAAPAAGHSTQSRS